VTCGEEKDREERKDKGRLEKGREEKEEKGGKENVREKENKRRNDNK
jgi:hypothetical protein